MFVLVLDDDESEIRWTAAEGLIELGGNGAIAALEALVENSDSLNIRQGVHHVLRDFNRRAKMDLIEKVIKSLDGEDAAIQAPITAKKALGAMKNKI